MPIASLLSRWTANIVDANGPLMAASVRCLTLIQRPVTLRLRPLYTSLRDRGSDDGRCAYGDSGDAEQGSDVIVPDCVVFTGCDLVAIALRSWPSISLLGPGRLTQAQGGQYGDSEATPHPPERFPP